MTLPIRKAALCSAALVAGLLAYPALTQQRTEPPIARYTMDAGTTSGFGAMGAAGVNPLAMLRGGGGSAMHELQLRLGSSRSASGTPAADHFMPAGAQLGTSVPLVSPTRQPSGPVGTPGEMPQGQLPSGKLYLFWGCGERAGPGQPVVIDFARMARGEVPPDLFASGVALPSDWHVGPDNSTTFGEWPNARDTKQVTPASSLRGAHRIAGNYSPEISFTLDRDFMPALQPRSAPLASGAWSLSWNGLPEATGYYAWAMGAKDMGQGQASEMVWWTSSSTRHFAGALADWLSPAAVQRLVTAGTVMPPSQTTCAIPAEVRQIGGDMMMLNLYGYGPESNFAYPPRPEDTRVAWRPEWTARVRFRSSAMTMLGMPDRGGFGGDDDEGSESARGSPEPEPQDTLPPCPRGLAGRAMRAAGVCQ